MAEIDTMAKAKAPHMQPAKTPTKAPAAPAQPASPPAQSPVPMQTPSNSVSTPAVLPQDRSEQPSATSAPKASTEGSVFSSLWERFCSEANFSSEALETEADVVREEIAKLEERIAEKRTELDAITHREETARDKMTALLNVGFSDEAVLSAMKVEFRAKKPAVRTKEKEIEVGEDEKTAVLDVLDREGQPLGEIVKLLGRDPKDVQRVLTALAGEGKVNTQGERKGKLYMRA